MSEFMAASSDVQMERAANYAPLDLDTARILSDYLDEIIASQANARSASSEEGAFNEWFEMAVILADVNTDVAYLWPLTQQRVMIRRTLERGERALGETYNVVMEWSVLRDDLVDPGYTKGYVLMVPYDAETEDPKLLMCQQQSLFFENPAGEQVALSTIESSYHEVDSMLSRSYYDTMSRGTVYDAERLFDELTLFGDASQKMFQGKGYE